MRGKVLGLRQQPILKACKFDIFVWRPADAFTSPVSNYCNNTLGVTRGSSAMNGIFGLVQQNMLCFMSMEQYYNNLVQASNDYYGKTGGDVCDSSRYSE